MLEILVLVLRLAIAPFRSRRDLILENLALHHQLDVALRNQPRLRLRRRDRILWVWLRRAWPSGWLRNLVFVQPRTVIGWHRRGWRLYWTWRSRARLGRPRLSAEIRELIARMSRDNPLWGTERIRGELLKLGADLFVVQTVSFRTLYVFFFITHARRELVQFNVTANPTGGWIWQQVINATPWDRQPRYLIHDRDVVYGKQFDARLGRLGVASVMTPVRAPRANSIAERVVRTFRRECLDHVVVINERHLRALLTEFVRYYNHDRPHRSLDHETPVPRERARDGPIVSWPILGGLHHAYARAA